MSGEFPTDADLARLLRGELASDEESRLEALLSESPVLQKRLEALSGAADFKSEFHAEEDVTVEAPGSGIPERLGGYEIESHVATGGMGVVYRARDPDLKRTVAIKLLSPTLAANGEASERFLREAAAAAAIEHPNIVPIYAIDRESGEQPFLVMRFIEGQTLQDYLDGLSEGESPSDEFILSVAKSITRALEAAHDKGLIHRDIKPSNILLEGKAPADGVWPESKIFLTDFGLARAIEETAVLTNAGTFIGTPKFTSPEQAEGIATVDHRADLFSLGSVLYTLAAGRTPFKGDSPTSTIYQVVHKPHAPVQESNPGRPGWLAKVIDRLLAKDPEDRYRGAEDVLACLEGKTPMPPATGEPKSGKPPVLVFAAGLAAVVAIVAFLFFNGSKDDPPESGVPPADTPTFIIQRDQSVHASLPDALAASESGDTIVINVPREANAVHVSPLSVEAGKEIALVGTDTRSRPVLVQSDATMPLFDVSGSLALENLHFRRTAEAEEMAEPTTAFLQARDGSVTIRRCRFELVSREGQTRELSLNNVANAMVLYGACDFEMADSELYVVRQRAIRVDLANTEKPPSVSLENNIVCAMTGLGFVGGSSGSPETNVTLRNNTFIGQNTIGAFARGKSFPLRITAERNVMDATAAVVASRGTLEMLRTSVRWKGQENLFLTENQLVRGMKVRSGGRTGGPATLAEWAQFWNLRGDSGSVHRSSNALSGRFLPFRTKLEDLQPEDLAPTGEETAPLEGVGASL